MVGYGGGTYGGGFYGGAERFYGSGTYGGGTYGGVTMSPTGVQLLPGVLDANARLIVEIAWGADLSGSETAWQWRVSTDHIRMADGIDLSAGRADEASTTQPATCAFTLDNDDGVYTTSPMSPLWPYIRIGTPVRVRADPNGDGGYFTLFHGFIDSIAPEWGGGGFDRTTKVSASGALRRLGQRTSPVLSSLRRALSTDAQVVAYWPLEDQAGSTYGSSDNPSRPDMLWTVGEPNFGSATEFRCSASAAAVNNSALDGTVAPYANTNEWQVRFLIEVPDAGLTASSNIARIYTDDSTHYIYELEYGGGAGSMQLRVLSPSGSTVFDTGIVAFAINGLAGRIWVQAEQSGSSVKGSFGFQELVSGTAPFFAFTITSAKVGAVNRVIIAYDFNHPDLLIGHVVVQDMISSIFADNSQLIAYVGDFVTPGGTGRLSRLAAENRLTYDALGDGTTLTGDEARMGPQGVDSLLNLLREAEATDHGILYDGVHSGLRMRTRRKAESDVSTGIVINMSLPRRLGPPTPVADDQQITNRVTVARIGGVSATVEQTGGPTGTGTVGTFDTAVSLSMRVDSTAVQHAGWLLSVGSAAGPRVRGLRMDLAGMPTLADVWAGVCSRGPGEWMTIIGLDQVALGHDPADVNVIIQGWRQRITPYEWVVEVDGTPADPYHVPVVAVESGDVGRFVGRVHLDGQTVGATVPAGSTSLSVVTPAGARLLTTVADDYPMVLDVAGLTVSATGCSGSSSPQTLTVVASDLAKTISAGSTIELKPLQSLGL